MVTSCVVFKLRCMLLVPLNRGETKAQFTLSLGYSWNLYINLSIFHLLFNHRVVVQKQERYSALPHNMPKFTNCPSLWYFLPNLPEKQCSNPARVQCSHNRAT